MAGKKNKTTRESPQLDEATFRLLFENHPLPMWIYDMETLAFLEVNDAALQKYGYTREEFLGLTLKDIRPAQDVPRLLEDISEYPAHAAVGTEHLQARAVALHVGDEDVALRVGRGVARVGDIARPRCRGPARSG